MRLIDADRLLNPGYTDMWDEPIKFDMISRYAIESEPTVEAIPIEWIKKWLNNIANNVRYKNQYVVLNEEVKRIVYRQAVIIKVPCISDMLEDWEKENGAEESNRNIGI